MCLVSLMYLLVYIYIYIYIYIHLFMLTSNTLIREIVARLPRYAKDFSLLQSTHIGSGTSPPTLFLKLNIHFHLVPKLWECNYTSTFPYTATACAETSSLMCWSVQVNTSAIRLYRYYQTGNVRINVNTEARPCNRSRRGKAICITDSDCDL